MLRRFAMPMLYLCRHAAALRVAAICAVYVILMFAFVFAMPRRFFFCCLRFATMPLIADATMPRHADAFDLLIIAAFRRCRLF